MRSFTETLLYRLWLQHVRTVPLVKPPLVSESTWNELDTESRLYLAWHEWMHEQAELFYAEEDERLYTTNPLVKRNDSEDDRNQTPRSG